MLKKILFIVLILNIALSCSGNKEKSKMVEKKGDLSLSKNGLLLDESIKDGLYAIIQTDRGDIVIEFYYQKSPMTVTNFVGLASGKLTGKAFYNGLKFHRVEPGFVIQGGDPSGNGTGGPGYEFPNEINSELSHVKGAISMANAGPDTNGSQFFIMLDTHTQLDGSYSVFGKTLNAESDKIVSSIKVNDIMKQVVIVPKGKEATDFFNNITKDDFNKMISGYKEKAKLELSLKQKDKIEKSMVILSRLGEPATSPEGIMYVITKQGQGEKPKANQEVECHYTLTLLDGTKLDSSVDRNETFKFNVGQGKVIKGWDITLMDMKKGEKRTIILPPELGYGSRGAGGVVPPNAFLKFDIELIDYK